MIRVTIDNPEKALEAGAWCNRLFGDKWQLHGQNVISGKNPLYHFEFYNTLDAMLFSLKWI